MDYQFLTQFHPKVMDVVKRDPLFWKTFGYKIERKPTRIHSLNLIHEGQGLLEMDGYSYPLYPGVLFQISPGKHMILTSMQDEPLSFYGIQYEYVRVQWEGVKTNIFPSAGQLPFPSVFMIRNYSEMLSVFMDVYESWCGKMPDYEWEVKLAFLKLLGDLKLQEQAEIDSGHPNIHVVKKAIEYMRKNYRQGLTRESLASFLSLSPSYFSTLFKKHTGYTPIQYLNKIRIDQAKLLLRSTTLSIAEVSAESGFSDSFYFARVFSKITGMSPRDYRKG